MFHLLSTQTIFIGSVALNILGRLIAAAKKCKEEADVLLEEKNNKDNASLLDIENDLTGMDVFEGVVEEEESTKEKAKEEAQDSFIHPMILEKLNGLLDQVKPSCNCETIKEEEEEIGKSKTEESETIKKSWLDASELKKQVSTYFGVGSNTSTSAIKQETSFPEQRDDARDDVNDCLTDEVDNTAFRFAGRDSPCRIGLPFM